MDDLIIMILVFIVTILFVPTLIGFAADIVKFFMGVY